MIDKEKLKKLYKKCFDDKWDYNNDEITIGNYCAFCRDAIDRDDSIYCSVNGDCCGDVCLIDKNICGSKDSLVDKLGDYYDEEMEFEHEVYPTEYIEMIEEIRKALRKHTKKYRA